VLAVEERKSLNEEWRDDQRGVRVVIGIADDEPGAVLDRRGKEVELHAQGRKAAGTSNTRIASGRSLGRFAQPGILFARCVWLRLLNSFVG